MTELKILKCKRDLDNNLRITTSGPKLWLAKEDFGRFYNEIIVGSVFKIIYNEDCQIRKLYL